MESNLSREAIVGHLVGATVSSAMLEIHEFNNKNTLISMILEADRQLFSIKCSNNGEGIFVFFLKSGRNYPVDMEESGTLFLCDTFSNISLHQILGKKILDIAFDELGNIEILFENVCLAIMNIGDNFTIDLR